MFFKMKIAEGVIREYANIVHWDLIKLLNPEFKDDLYDMCKFYGELAVLQPSDDTYMNPYRLKFTTNLYIDDKDEVFTDDGEELPVAHFSIDKSNFRDYINYFYNLSLQSHIFDNNGNPVKTKNPFFTPETINAYTKRHFTPLDIMKFKVKAKNENSPLQDEKYLKFFEEYRNSLEPFQAYNFDNSLRYNLSKYYFENVSGKLTDTPDEYFDWLNKNLP